MGKSNYPNLIDSDVELPRVDNNITEIGADAINSIRDAIFTIERVLGKNPQGNLSDLVTRINTSIDADGRIKTSALSSRGLVTLPIVDSHIGGNAGIQESKLDLDYGTSFLNSRINSANTDIDTLRTSFTAFVAQTVNHFNGTSNRHDGYDVDLVESIRSSDDIETALHVINNAFTDHEQSIIGAHRAYGISVNNEFINISADNVQDALIELDAISSGKGIASDDSLHASAVAMNKRGEIGYQGNLKETTLAPTIFQTESSKSTNIMQVMRPNVARITSKNMDLRALSVGSSNYLRIQAGGINRDPLDINLAAIIPTDDVNDIVNAINTKAQGCNDHYPISAYNTGGKLTIAHNIPGAEFTISVLSTVQFSAHVALGFGSIANQEISWSGNAHSGYASGIRINDLKPLVKIHHNHLTKPLNVIIPGLGDLSRFGLTIGDEGRVLVNITNHSTTPTDNGTHYIIGYPTNEKFVLSADIQLGEFDLEIMADSTNFTNAANGEIFDIFIEPDSDGYGIVTKSKKVSYVPNGQVSIRAVSTTYPATVEGEWQVTDTNRIQLHIDGESGLPVEIPTGFQGELRVYAPDNINSALFEITGIPTTGKMPMTIYNFGGTDGKIYIGSVHYSGSFGSSKLKFVTDRRQLGASIENISSDIFSPTLIQQAVADLRNNGVIRGLDIISTDGQSLKIRGGRAYVEGNVIDIETQDIDINDFSVSQQLLLLDSGGNFIVKGEFEPGFLLSDLTANDSHGDNRNVAIIAQFSTNGTSIDGYTDQRLVLGNIDKKLVNLESSLIQEIDEVRSAASGSFWGFTQAAADGNDGYLGSLELGNCTGFTYIDQVGFAGGNALITTRRFEFTDLDLIKHAIFKAPGLTHINIFSDIEYTGTQGGPFGVSGTVSVDLGVVVEVGQVTVNASEEYATVRTFVTSILSQSSVTERYVASIPTSALSVLDDNYLFSLVPRVRIQGSLYVDGGPGGSDHSPTMKISNVRVVTSSYSIAGNILSEDGSDTPLAVRIGDVL